MYATELETIQLSSVVNVSLQHIDDRSFSHHDTLTTEGTVYSFRLRSLYLFQGRRWIDVKFSHCCSSYLVIHVVLFCMCGGILNFQLMANSDNVARVCLSFNPFHPTGPFNQLILSFISAEKVL